MPQRGTTNSNPDLRQAPNDTAEVLSKVANGTQMEVLGPAGNGYLSVRLDDGRIGFLRAADVIQFVNTPPAPPQPGNPPTQPSSVNTTPVQPPPAAGAFVAFLAHTQGNPNFHSQPNNSQASVIRVLGPNVRIQVTGEKVPPALEYWPCRIVDTGEVGFIHQALVVEGIVAPPGLQITLGSPLESTANITCSSLSPDQHHVVYGGGMSFDMAPQGPGRGMPVHFRVRANDTNALRGVVFFTKTACRDGIIEHGGLRADIRIERQDANGRWQDTGMGVTYAHMDPLMVQEGSVLNDGDVIGLLGPKDPMNWTPAQATAICGFPHSPGDPKLLEYHSECAQHSHTHIEPHGTSEGPRTDSGTYAFGQELTVFRL